MSIGLALTVPQLVTEEPSFTLSHFPTCLQPFSATIFVGFCTVVKPLASTLQIASAPNLYCFIRASRLLKNAETVSRLKLVDRVLQSTDRFCCLFRKPRNHSYHSRLIFFPRNGNSQVCNSKLYIHMLACNIQLVINPQCIRDDSKQYAAKSFLYMPT